MKVTLTILLFFLIPAAFLSFMMASATTQQYYQLVPYNTGMEDLSVNNGTWVSLNLKLAVKTYYNKENFEVGESLTFYCENVKTGNGILKIMYLDSAGYAALQASQSYTPLAELNCDNITGGSYEAYGHLNYQVASVDDYYLVFEAVSTDCNVITFSYKTGFIGTLGSSVTLPPIIPGFEILFVMIALAGMVVFYVLKNQKTRSLRISHAETNSW